MQNRMVEGEAESKREAAKRQLAADHVLGFWNWTGGKGQHMVREYEAINRGFLGKCSRSKLQ